MERRPQKGSRSRAGQPLVGEAARRPPPAAAGLNKTTSASESPVNEVHLRVADGRRLSSEATQRLARLLDGEILPRLERPGRYVGWVSPRDLEAPPAQAPVHLVWPCPPEGPLSPPQLEPLRRALEARGIEISYGATPTPELIALLDRHDLGAFAHDQSAAFPGASGAR